MDPVIVSALTAL